MKKTILTLVAAAATLFSTAQSSLNGLGLGFNYNGTNGVPEEMVIANFDNQDIKRYSKNGYSNLNRVLSSYEFSFKPSKKEYFFVDMDVLQGAEFIYSSTYESSRNGDTSFSSNAHLDMSSSILGLKTIARFSTPTEKRFFYNVGLGLEGLWAYNVAGSGSLSTSAFSWQSNYNHSTYTSITSRDLSNYSSYNILQQIGAAWRLGKDETKFPLNNTYLELNFQINNNFTLMKETLSKYRTYGFTLSMVYELR